MNILFCSAGRRVQLMKDFKTSLSAGSRVIAADMSPLAPALFVADAYHLVPAIDDPGYLDAVLRICEEEHIDAITTLIDPEISLLAHNRDRFEERDITVLVSDARTADACFDKYQTCAIAREHGIPVPKTYGTAREALAAVDSGEVAFPLFAKPRCGSGSVGACPVQNAEKLEAAFQADPTLIAQELVRGTDVDADTYVDLVSGEAVSIFCKRKLEMRIGGASKAVSFRDPELFSFVRRVVAAFDFRGPIDMDLFRVGDHYLLNEVNPRFGGAYLHAYGCGVDFVPLIERNARGESNPVQEPSYEEGIAMMMYDAIVLAKVW